MFASSSIKTGKCVNCAGETPDEVKFENAMVFLCRKCQATDAYCGDCREWIRPKFRGKFDGLVGYHVCTRCSGDEDVEIAVWRKEEKAKRDRPRMKSVRVPDDIESLHVYSDGSEKHSDTKPGMWKTCTSCLVEFYLSPGELKFFHGKRLDIPKRCLECRKQRGGSIVCPECGTERLKIVEKCPSCPQHKPVLGDNTAVTPEPSESGSPYETEEDADLLSQEKLNYEIEDKVNHKFLCYRKGQSAWVTRELFPRPSQILSNYENRVMLPELDAYAVPDLRFYGIWDNRLFAEDGWIAQHFGVSIYTRKTVMLPKVIVEELKSSLAMKNFDKNFDAYRVLQQLCARLCSITTLDAVTIKDTMLYAPAVAYADMWPKVQGVNMFVRGKYLWDYASTQWRQMCTVSCATISYFVMRGFGPASLQDMRNRVLKKTLDKSVKFGNLSNSDKFLIWGVPVQEELIKRVILPPTSAANVAANFVASRFEEIELATSLLSGMATGGTFFQTLMFRLPAYLLHKLSRWLPLGPGILAHIAFNSMAVGVELGLSAKKLVHTADEPMLTVIDKGLDEGVEFKRTGDGVYEYTQLFYGLRPSVTASISTIASTLLLGYQAFAKYKQLASFNRKGNWKQYPAFKSVNVSGIAAKPVKREKRILEDGSIREVVAASMHVPMQAVKKKEPTVCQYRLGIGVKGFRPVVHAPTLENEICAVEARVVNNTPMPKLEQECIEDETRVNLTDFSRWFKMHVHKLFPKAYHAVVSTQWENYIANSNASPAVKKILNDTHTRLESQGITEDSKLDKQQLYEWTRRAAFVKVENLCHRGLAGTLRKAPRLIQGAPPEFISLVGPFIMSVQGWVSKIWKHTFPLCFTSGIKSSKIAKMITEPGWKIFENDVSAYDSSIRKELCELEVWLAKWFGAPRSVIDLMTANIRTHGYTSQGVKYRVLGTRKSGDPYTSVFNSVLNACMHLYIFCRVHKMSVDDAMQVIKMAVQGDDNIGCHRGPPVDWAKYMSQLGFETKPMYHSDPTTATFCSCRLVPVGDTYVFAPKVGRLLAKNAYYVNPPHAYSAEQLVRGTSISLYEACRVLPPVRAVLDRILELTKGIQTKWRANEPWKMKFDGHEPTAETWEFLWKCYGWDQHNQQRLEEELASKKLGDELTGILPQMLCDIDVDAAPAILPRLKPCSMFSDDMWRPPPAKKHATSRKARNKLVHATNGNHAIRAVQTTEPKIFEGLYVSNVLTNGKPIYSLCGRDQQSCKKQSQWVSENMVVTSWLINKHIKTMPDVVKLLDVSSQHLVLENQISGNWRVSCKKRCHTYMSAVADIPRGLSTANLHKNTMEFTHLCAEVPAVDNSTMPVVGTFDTIFPKGACVSENELAFPYFPKYNSLLQHHAYEVVPASKSGHLWMSLILCDSKPSLLFCAKDKESSDAQAKWFAKHMHNFEVVLKSILGADSYVRDLTREGIEPNPGWGQNTLEELQFKYHGNYGGPGYSGGKFGKEANFSSEPQDKLDEAFKEHDSHYAVGHQEAGDKVLVKRLQDIPGWKARLAQLGFSLKSMLGLSRDVPIPGTLSLDELYGHLTRRQKQVVRRRLSSPEPRVVKQRLKQQAVLLTQGVEPNPGPGKNKHKNKPPSQQAKKREEKKVVVVEKIQKRPKFKNNSGNVLHTPPTPKLYGHKTYRVSSSKGKAHGIRLFARDYLTQVATDSNGAINGDVVYAGRIDPFNANSMCSGFARMYTKYKIHSYKIHYDPVVGDNTGGDLIGAFSTDPDDPFLSTGISTVRTLLNRNGSKATTVHKFCTWNMPRTNKVYFLPGADNQYQPDQRLEYPGQFILAALAGCAASTTYGVLLTEIDIEFFSPNLNVVAPLTVASYIVPSGGAVAYNPYGKFDLFGLLLATDETYSDAGSPARPAAPVVDKESYSWDLVPTDCNSIHLMRIQNYTPLSGYPVTWYCTLVLPPGVYNIAYYIVVTTSGVTQVFDPDIMSLSQADSGTFRATTTMNSDGVQSFPLLSANYMTGPGLTTPLLSGVQRVIIGPNAIFRSITGEVVSGCGIAMVQHAGNQVDTYQVKVCVNSIPGKSWGWWFPSPTGYSEKPTLEQLQNRILELEKRDKIMVLD